MGSPVRFAATVQEQLQAALVEEATVRHALSRAQPERGSDGSLRYRCSLPVSRPLDPEFLQIVELEVVLRPRGDAWEVVEVHGLELPEA